ncbi:hypothetical protein Btru_046573 [Bulinus truncatus]|nr:hypothetical protein Btru_046573 [Bulinus truncatus]
MSLVLGLCIEDVCCCEVMVSQIATGQVFGLNQRLHLVIQGPSIRQVDDLCDELQDCAYPLVQGISGCVSFRDSGIAPDVVMVILSGRCEQREPSSLVGPLDSLVKYIHGLSQCMTPGQLNGAKIVVVGDMAAIAANLLWDKMNTTNMAASHFIAVDGYMEPASIRSPRGLGQIQRICSWVRQWWTGCKEISGIYLGSKFLDVSQPKGNGAGYFFSALVEIDGRQNFHVRPKWTAQGRYIAELCAKSDTAMMVMHQLEDRRVNKTHTTYASNL